MRKIIFTMLLSIVVIAGGCASANEQEPFAELEEEYKSGDKELELEVINREEFAKLSEELVNIISGYEGYFRGSEEQMKEVEAINELENYESRMKPFYEWCYKVIYFDNSKVDEELSEAWDQFQKMAMQIRDRLNTCGEQGFEEAATTSSELMRYISDTALMIKELVPMETINVGQTITVDDFAEITIKSVDYRNQIYPSDTSGYYTYYDLGNSDTTYFACNFDFTNLKSESDYNIFNYINCELTYEGGYKYDGFIVCDEGNRFTTFPDLIPLKTLDTWAIFEVPASLQDSALQFTVTINGKTYVYH